VQERLEQIPGVRSASLSLNAPQQLCCISLDISIGGRPDTRLENIDVGFSRVSPHYFETIGTPLVRGRTFSQNDTQSAPHVTVVDESFARTFFPGEDALGKHIGSSLQEHGFDYEIVGVVKDTAYRSPNSVQRPMYFLPFTQTTSFPFTGYQRMETGTLYASLIELSVNGAPDSYQKAFRSALAEIDPNLSVINLKSYTEGVAVQFNQQRLIARLTGLFSLLALLLASIGLYGVTAYNVSRRTAEIGIRMALGANRGDVVSMVLRGALLQVAIGLAIGVPIAILCGRYLAHQLYGVARFDPVVLGGATLILSLCALIAGLVPARRAASIEPTEALRIE
jgi:predicted permease